MSKKKIIIIAVILIAAVVLIMWKEGVFSKKSAKQSEDPKEETETQGIKQPNSSRLTAVTPEQPSDTQNSNESISTFSAMKKDAVAPKVNLSASVRANQPMVNYNKNKR